MGDDALKQRQCPQGRLRGRQSNRVAGRSLPCGRLLVCVRRAALPSLSEASSRRSELAPLPGFHGLQCATKRPELLSLIER